MAKTREELIQMQLGAMAFQIAVLAADLEEAREKNAELVKAAEELMAAQKNAEKVKAITYRSESA